VTVSGFSPSNPARERFTEIAGMADEEIDLAEAALWIAAEAFPDLPVDAYLAKLDRIADSVRPALENVGLLEQQVEALNLQLFGVLGFRGARDDYYDPRNSFLNEVLDRKTGIPISLSVVYIEIARRLGLDAAGMNFPGHFLARVGDDPIIVDAFEGRITTPRECKTRLTATLGANAELTPELLAPTGNKPILLRMLSNLKSIYASRKDFVEAVACCDRCLLIAPDSPLELRDRGLMYHGLDCARPALMDLERYLELDPDGEETDAIRELVGQLHQQVPPIH
jgi:regulator of sirC expression with transglutaminase-like and TPR domain